MERTPLVKRVAVRLTAIVIIGVTAVLFAAFLRAIVVVVLQILSEQ